jgi:HD-GYP domain-containing protein (c-di-GMP phosphodiesterase class II)
MADAPAPTPQQRPNTAAGDPRLQALYRNVLTSLYTLIRSVKLYDPDNAVFQKPLNALLETVNKIILVENKLQLSIAENSFYMNGQLVRVDQGTLENMKFLATEMERRQVGGFALAKPGTLQDLKNFIWIFAKDQTESAGEDGVGSRKLTEMRLSRWTAIKEKLSNDDSGPVDRKKYVMTVYARMIVYMNAYLEEVRQGRPAPPVGKLGKLVQDMVDISRDRASQFMGMTSTGEGEQALTHHLVNTALIAMAFANELGLPPGRTRELGMAAMLSGVPLLRLAPEHRFVPEPEKLPAPVPAQLRQLRRLGASQTLTDLGPTRAGFMSALATAHAGTPYGKPTRDSRGRINLVIPEGDPLFFARIINICSFFDRITSTTPDHEAYGPDIALDLMWNQARWRFDPELLTVFMRVMAQQPFKMLSKKKGGVVDLAGV